MIVFIKTLIGTTYLVEIESADTVLEFKEKYSKLCNVPVDQQRLIFAGKQLKNHKTLVEYNIQRESTIYQTLRLRGGGYDFSNMEMKDVEIIDAIPHNHKSVWVGPGLNITMTCCGKVQCKRMGINRTFTDPEIIIKCEICEDISEDKQCVFHACRYKWEGVCVKDTEVKKGKGEARGVFKVSSSTQVEWHHLTIRVDQLE